MYSILGRGAFCFNYCLNSAWHGATRISLALLRWYGSPGFFDSGLQLICVFGLLFFIFLLTIPRRFSWGSGLESLLASEAHQHLTNFWCFWQCGQVPNPAPNFLVNGCSDIGFQKTMDQHQQMTLHPKSSQTVET